MKMIPPIEAAERPVLGEEVLVSGRFDGSMKVGTRA
jgi:hypothetical protein